MGASRIMTKENGRKITARTSKSIAGLFLAISHPKRVMILHLLSLKSMEFNELLDATNLHKTALSNHLNLLIEKRLIDRISHGNYEITSDGLDILNSALNIYNNSKHRVEEERQRLMERYAPRSDDIMKSIEVEIVKLEPMNVASVRAISRSPEEDAWKKMVSFAEPRGLLKDLKKHPIFGFNNPNPSKEGGEYGYEFWIKVDDSVDLDDSVEKKEFKGGLYAVTRCNLTKEVQSEFLATYGVLESWHRLSEWLKESQYEMGVHQCLEKSVNPTDVDADHMLDLYMPIKK